MGIENLLLGFQIAITPFNLSMAVVGILLGTIIGVLPGLGGANGVAILLPLTFTMPPTSAIILAHIDLLGRAFRRRHYVDTFQHPRRTVVGGDNFRRLPDGAPGAGRAGAYRRIHFLVYRRVVLDRADYVFAPVLAEIALKFGPPEIFAIQFLTFSSFVGLGGGNPLKSLVSILIGFILATVGLDIITGHCA